MSQDQPNVVTAPQREVVCADAIPWLRERGRIEGACAVTSLPDVSELGVTLPVWRDWFLGAVRLVVDAVPDASAAIFFQSDIKYEGRWIDKGAMVVRAAEDAGVADARGRKLDSKPSPPPPPDEDAMPRIAATSDIPSGSEIRRVKFQS